MVAREATPNFRVNLRLTPMPGQQMMQRRRHRRLPASSRAVLPASELCRRTCAALAFLETFWRVARELAASSDGPTRRIFSMVDAAGEAGRGAGSRVSARQTLTQYG
ncbi:hypothetical protein DBA34_08375 [Pandoraea cepalis]|uniref:Uncharacterized protein n=1 Tax=Pandoraea cepalis TaxID=2508294 RepID=A0AAW7MKQ0_9BURK|nr:hypothetical protein [Pandoraea cepalis]